MAPKKKVAKEIATTKGKSKTKKLETARAKEDKEGDIPRGKYYAAHCAFEDEDVTMLRKKSPSPLRSQSSEEEQQDIDAIEAEMEAEMAAAELEAERKDREDEARRTENNLKGAKASATTAFQSPAKTTDPTAAEADDVLLLTATASEAAPDTTAATTMPTAADANKTATPAATSSGTEDGVRIPIRKENERGESAEEKKKGEWKEEENEWKEWNEWKGDEREWKGDERQWKGDEKEWKKDEKEWKENEKKWKKEEKDNEVTPIEVRAEHEAGKSMKKGTKDVMMGRQEDLMEADKNSEERSSDQDNDEMMSDFFAGIDEIDITKPAATPFEEKPCTDNDTRKQAENLVEEKAHEDNGVKTIFATGDAENANEWKSNDWSATRQQEWNETKKDEGTADVDMTPVKDKKGSDSKDWSARRQQEWNETKKDEGIADVDMTPVEDKKESDSKDWSARRQQEWNETKKDQDTTGVAVGPVEDKKDNDGKDWNATRQQEWKKTKTDQDTANVDVASVEDKKDNDGKDWNATRQQEWSETKKDEGTADVNMTPVEDKKEWEKEKPSTDWDASGNDWYATEDNTNEWSTSKKQEWNAKGEEDDAAKADAKKDDTNEWSTSKKQEGNATGKEDDAVETGAKENDTSDWGAQGNGWKDQADADADAVEEEEEAEDSDDRVEIGEDEDGNSIEIHVKHVKYDDALGQLLECKEALEEASGNVEITLKKQSVTVCGIQESVTLAEAYLKATQITASGDKVPKAVLQAAIAAKHCVVRRYRTDDANQFKVLNLGKMSKKVKSSVLVFELEDEKDGTKKNVAAQEDKDEKESGGSSSSWGDKDWKANKNDWDTEDNDWNTDKNDWKSNNDWNKTEATEETYATIAICSPEPVDRWMVDLMWIRFYEMDHPGFCKETFGSEDCELDEFAYILNANDIAGRAIGKGGEYIKRIERIFGARGHAKFVGEKGATSAICVGDSEEARDTVVAFMRSLLDYQKPALGSSRTIPSSLADQMRRLPHEELMLKGAIPTKNIETNVEGIFVYEVPTDFTGDVVDMDWSDVKPGALVESRDPEASDKVWEEGTFQELTIRAEDGFPMIRLELTPGYSILRKCTDVRLKEQRILIFGENQDARDKGLALCKEYAADPSLYESKSSSWGSKNDWGAKKTDSNDWGAKKADNDWASGSKKSSDWGANDSNDWAARKEKSSDWVAKDNDWSKEDSGGWKKRQLDDDAEQNDWKKRKW